MALESLGVRVFIVGMGELRRDLGTMRQDLGTTASTIDALGTRTLSFADRLNALGNGMIALGRTMTLGITVPLAILGATLGSAAVEFEDGFQAIAKTSAGAVVGFDEIAAAAKRDFGLTVTNMDQAKAAAEMMGMSFGDLTPIGEKMREQFRQLALDIPIPTNELLKLGEELSMLGVSNADIAEMTKLMAELGAVTDITAEDAANGLIHIRNVANEGNLSMVEFAKSAGSALVALSNDSASTGDQILNLATRIAAAGNAAKFTGPEILAWATTLGDVGSRAEAGGTAVSRMVDNMILAVSNGGKELQTFAQVSGESVDQFKKAFEEDASAAMLKFIGNLREMLKEGNLSKDMLNEMGLGGVRAFDIINRLGEATDLYSKNLDVASKAWVEQIALAESAEKRFNSVKNQIQLLKNAFTDLGITLFDLVKDDFKRLVQGIIDAIKWFKNLSPTIQTFTLRVAGILAALGPVIAAFGIAAKVAAVVLTAFEVVNPVVLALAAAFLALGVAMALPKIDLGNIGGAPTGAGIAPAGPANPHLNRPMQEHKAPLAQATGLEEFQQSMLDLQDNVSAVFQQMIKGATDFATGFGEGFKPFIETTAPQIQEIFKNLGQAIDNLKPLGEAVGGLIEALTGGKVDFGTLGDQLGRIAGMVFSGFIDFLDNLSEDLPGIVTNLTNFTTGLGQFVDGFNEKAPDLLKTNGPEFLGWLQSLGEAGEKLPALVEALNGLADALSNLLGVTADPKGLGQTVGFLSQFSLLNLSGTGPALDFLITNLPNIIQWLTDAANNATNFVNNLNKLDPGPILNVHGVLSDLGFKAGEVGAAFGAFVSFVQTQMTALSISVGGAVQTLNGILGSIAFSKVADAAASMATHIQEAFNAIVEAAKAALADLTGSPELKLQHPFEEFEKFMKATPIPDIMGNMAPADLTSAAMQAIIPAGAGSTSIDRSLNIGDISGVPMRDENSLSDILLKTTRQMQALGEV